MQGQSESAKLRPTRRSQPGSLGRQSSFYPQSLGKFQHTKNLCSMNSNEFLTSGMWTAEEIPNQQQSFDNANLNNGVTSSSYLNCDQENHQQIARWHGSQTAVEEQVWPAGTQESGMADHGYYNSSNNYHLGGYGRRQTARTAETTPLQASFQDMTTEDSLVKEGGPMATTQQQQPSSGALYWDSYTPAPVARFPPQQPERVLNNSGEERVDSSGMDGRRMRRQRQIATPKRGKEVEKRERRLMKKRESAVRLRARKQAYAVELQAELNLLKKENAQLKQAMHHEGMKMKVTKKFRAFRRSLSCPLWN